jgi:hypothetical protein
MLLSDHRQCPVTNYIIAYRGRRVSLLPETKPETQNILATLLKLPVCRTYIPSVLRTKFILLLNTSKQQI